MGKKKTAVPAVPAPPPGQAGMKTEITAIAPTMVECESIRPSPANNRTDKTHGIEALAADIRSHGLLQPPQVRPVKGGGNIKIALDERVHRARFETFQITVEDHDHLLMIKGFSL